MENPQSNPSMTETEISAWLGRPLTDVEHQNFDNYLELVSIKLADLLCVEDLTEIEPKADLKNVLAQMFGSVVTTAHFDGNVQSKEVEDFRVTYKDTDLSPMDAVIAKNGGTIAKYAKCSIRHGRTLKESGIYYHDDGVRLF